MRNKSVSLFEEYRLIERSENEVNGAWKGAHILLFFLAFVFGSFCTFCFHMLMYMFDEKCVLFPKLQSLTSLQHNVIYEFIPIDKDSTDIPVDFLSTQWMEKSACYLPTYVPLVSGIFGLVWTTMFLMCSTGSRTLTGLQRPWRILPPVFLFSLAMGGFCIYSSAMTHYGLEELCMKLSEITGSTTCTYTVNVATIVYERRIRGVYQATRLTILSAWLHTACWILSAVLALVRVAMVVDFQLVRINVNLVGDIEKMLENQETHIRTVSPDRWIYASDTSMSSQTSTSSKIQYKSKNSKESETTNMMCMLYYDDKGVRASSSAMSLVPEERNRLAKKHMLLSIDTEHYFILEMVFDLVDNISLPSSLSTPSSEHNDSSMSTLVIRQYGKSKILSWTEQEILQSIKNKKDGKKKKPFFQTKSSRSLPSTSKEKQKSSIIKRMKKSNLKNVSIQTDEERKKRLEDKSSQRVKISEVRSDASGSSSDDKINKKSQTSKKEKQD